ncbi:MAG: CopG family transcriptional regulator [Dehalococcoidia bacterium]
MRTTVTLDPDLAARLKELARQRRISFKSAINSTLRTGLESETNRGRPYHEKSRALGVQPGVDLTKALQLAAALEDEETIHKLGLRK